MTTEKRTPWITTPEGRGRKIESPPPKKKGFLFFRPAGRQREGNEGGKNEMMAALAAPRVW